MMVPTHRIYPVDYIVMGYTALISVMILVLGRPIGGYLPELAFYVGVGILSWLISRYVDEKRSRAHALFRLLYPAMLFTTFYSMTEGLNFLVFNSFRDPQVVAFEQRLFGSEVTQFIDKSQPSILVTELLSFCYFCYYLLIPGFLIPIFVRKDYHILREVLAAICLTFFVSYVLFSVYPVEGPRWFLADQYAHSVDGPVFRQMVNFVISNGAVHGGCMPSTHTAVSLVILLYSFKYYRRWGWILLPIVLGIAAGTVWGRFHYLSDVIVGAAIGGVSVWFIRKYHNRWIKTDLPIVQSGKVESARVS
jgi:membrane-associated phospholipid phosphatase